MDELTTAFGMDWKFDANWMAELEQELGDMIDGLAEHLFEEDEESDYEPPSGYPYCGCDVCFTREIIAFIVPKILQGSREGFLESTHRTVVDEVKQEIGKAHLKHGDNFIGSSKVEDGTRMTILTEEVGEVARAILERDEEGKRAELLQVAACCLAWLQAPPSDMRTSV